MEDMSLGQAIWIGFCQIFSAVFPGTSRSMSTIAGGQLVGMSRAAALEFSFFVSIPTMAARHALHAVQVAARQRRESDRRLADRRAWLDRARHRLRRLVHRRLWLGGVVHGLGPQARIRAVRGLPHYRRSAGAGVRGEIGVETLFAASARPTRASSDVGKTLQATSLRREANSTLQHDFLIVGSPASWHNVRALADCGTEECLCLRCVNLAYMDYLASIFVPTGNRRLNELSDS